MSSAGMRWVNLWWRVLAGVGAIAFAGVARAAPALEPFIKEPGWEEASLVLERWMKVQGFDRPPAEIYPRATTLEYLDGDESRGNKLSFVDTAGNEYRLIVELRDGKRYGEISEGNWGHWHMNEVLGNGQFFGTSEVVKTLRSARFDAKMLRKTYRMWLRLPDRERDGKNHQIVVMQQQHTGGHELWWFDAETGVLNVVDILSPTKQLVGRTRFSDFRMVDGVLESHLTVFGEGEKRVSVRTSEIQNRAKIPAGFFAPSKLERERWQRSENILVHYVKASGGIAALAQIVSRVTKSEGENSASGVKFEVTLTQKAPNFYLAETEVSGLGRSTVGFDGENGWELSDLKGFRPLRGGELDLFRRNGQLNTENFPKMFPLRRLVDEGVLNGRKVVALELASLGAKAGVHYFDLESGQLLRVESSLVSGAEGTIPVTIDFSDFRAVDGVTMPFQSIMTNPAMRVTTKVLSVQHNVELDDAIFKPRKEE